MKAIDLSIFVNNDFITYPSDPDYNSSIIKTIEKDRSLVNYLQLGTHTGTHVDSPAHIYKDGKKLCEYNVNDFIGKAFVVNLNNYKKFIDLDIDFDVLLLDTNWWQMINRSEYYGPNRPKIPLDLLEFAIKKKIKCFGCDLPSVDESGAKIKINHKLLLSNDILIYESLTNLNQIKFNQVFTFYGLPLNFDLEASPVRAIGVR